MFLFCILNTYNIYKKKYCPVNLTYNTTDLSSGKTIYCFTTVRRSHKHIKTTTKTNKQTKITHVHTSTYNTHIKIPYNNNNLWVNLDLVILELELKIKLNSLACKGSEQRLNI